jgi:hypothetical protein
MRPAHNPCEAQGICSLCGMWHSSCDIVYAGIAEIVTPILSEKGLVKWVLRTTAAGRENATVHRVMSCDNEEDSCC